MKPRYHKKKNIPLTHKQIRENKKYLFAKEQKRKIRWRSKNGRKRTRKNK